MKFSEKLKNFKDCHDAIEWVGDKTLKEAWATCERADWMLWLSAKMIGKPGWSTHREIVLVGCWISRRAQKYWADKKDTRPMDAIKAVEQWVKIPTEENKNAAGAAGAAAWVTGAATGAARAAGDAEHKIMCEYIRKTLKIGRV